VVVKGRRVAPDTRRSYDRRMATPPPLRPQGVHHLAIATRDVKTQIEFFTQVLGGELKALYWMHGVENTFHAFVELSPTCCIAFQQHPDNPATGTIGVTHAGNAGGQVTAGTMQHLALAVDSLDDLLALRDRLRSHGVPVLGPMDHGMCRSMYFAGPEGLVLEIACGDPIDADAWIDPEVQALAGISDADLERYRRPAPFERPADPVAQPGPDAPGPHLGYPPAVWAMLLSRPDEEMWHAVEHRPPAEIRSLAEH
jgi:catechol 2,3-dioxygenase-like lactoylglutathione lyase family enzyme